MSTETRDNCFRPGLEGIPVANSKISYVDGQKGILEYRGIRVEELTEKSSFEETTYLLLKGKLPTTEQLEGFSKDLAARRNIKPKMLSILLALPDDAHPMEVLQAGVAALGMFHPVPNVFDMSEIQQAVVRLIAKLPSIVAIFHRSRTQQELIPARKRLSHSANFLYMLRGSEATPEEVRIFDAIQILHAEHTLNASTFGARVTASTLADPYNVSSSAIGSLTGPLHGGANERVLHMLESIGSIDQVPAWLDKTIAKKEKIFGFGHRVYKTKDPRAVVLQKLAKELLHGQKHEIFEIAEALEYEATQRLGTKGVYPNVDFYSGILYKILGIPADLFTCCFTMARVSGWLAHSLEQLEDNRIYRPTQVYQGDHGIPFIPISQRK